MKKGSLFLVLCMLCMLAACLTTKNATNAETLDSTSQESSQGSTQISSTQTEETIPLPTKSPAQTATVNKETLPAQAEVQTQPQAAPLKDRAQFKDEELISLDGRHLNPFISLPASAHEQTAPWKNEQLKYGVYYSFVRAGTAYIKNQGLVELEGRPAYLIQTSAFSASVIDTVFKVRDINYSWIDATDFYSRGYSQSLREGKYQRDEWVVFDYKNNTYWGEVKKKGELRSFTGSVTQQVLDILSALYYVRVQPLALGQNIIFDIINREEQYPLVVKVLKRETIKTAAGKFKCIVVEPQFRGEGIFVSKGKSLKVWLTDDKYKMPVKMKTEVFIGSVSAELLEYKRN